MASKVKRSRAKPRKNPSREAKESRKTSNEEKKLLADVNDDLNESSTTEGGPDELQIKEAQEIIERLQRKYRHKIQETEQSVSIDGPSSLDSPSKKREEDSEVSSNHDETESFKETDETLDDKENRILVTPVVVTRKSGHVRERFINKETPQIVRISPVKPPSSCETSLDLHLSTPPDNQSTSCIRRDKKRQSHFGFSRLESLANADLTLQFPPTPSTVDSLSLPKSSPSESPARPLTDDTAATGGGKKAVKALNFSNVSAAGPKDRKRPTRKTKKNEHKEVDEWIESINREFEEIDDFELVID